MSALLFDVGGTSLRAARWEGGPGLAAAVRCATPGFLQHPDRNGPELVTALVQAMIELAERLGLRHPDGLLVGFAGPVDERGRPWAAPTLWSDRVAFPLDLPALLAAAFPGARIAVLNDVSAAGYRYLREGERSFCVVTVSSGVGHKVFVDGQPAVGSHGRGGELGHLRVDWRAEAPRCDCGGLGHLGAVASGRAVAAAAVALAAEDPAAFLTSSLGIAATLPERVHAELLVAQAEDPWAGRLLGRLGAPLGRALAMLHLDTGVERFVLIGGFALAAGPVWRAAVVAAAREGCWDTGQDWEAMVQLGLADDDAGLIGLGVLHDRRRG